MSEAQVQVSFFALPRHADEPQADPVEAFITCYLMSLRI